MKTFTLTLAEAREIYPKVSKEFKSRLEDAFGVENLVLCDMEIQEIKIDGITYVKDEHSTLCSDCALVDKDCDIFMSDTACTACTVFNSHTLKVKEEYEK